MFDALPRYTDYEPAVPIWCVTPNAGGCLHRFFDTSPISPSGRYLACLRLPFEDRRPQPGQAAAVVLVDLHDGRERVVAETSGWEPQMGANINWGADDDTLLFNDVDATTWQSHCVVLNPHTGQKRTAGCGIYHASPDGRKVACANLAAMRRTQGGYGVVVPDDRVPRHVGPPEDDGLWVTDLESGECRLLVSVAECFRRCQPATDLAVDGRHEYYGFHCKWNRQGTRMIFTVRSYAVDEQASQMEVMHSRRWGSLRYNVFTLDNDASEIHLAVGAEHWDRGGHHINFFPDGEHLSMNLGIEGKEGLRLVQCRYDGTGLGPILPDLPGSGHPTVHPDGRHILTDDYAHGPFADDDGTTPLRWIDVQTGEDRQIARFRTRTPHQKDIASLRVDPHPAWDRSNRFVAFNAFVDGTRRVYIADMSELIDR